MNFRKFGLAAFKLAVIVVLFAWLLNYANVTFFEVIATLPDVNPILLLPALVFFFLHTLLAYCAWQLSLSLFQIDATVKETLPLYGFSTLTKYVPGGIWHAGSRVLVLGNLGYSKTSALLSVIYDSLLGIVMCGFLVFLLFPLVDTQLILSIDYPLLDYLLPVAALIILLMVLSPRLIAKCLFWHRAKEKAEIGKSGGLEFPRSTLIKITLLYVLALIMFVLANYFSFKMYLPELQVPNFEFSFIILFAVFAGLIAIFVPAGLGVRESILYLCFSRIIDDPLLITICLAPRFILLISELLFFFFCRYFPVPERLNRAST